MNLLDWLAASDRAALAQFPAAAETTAPGGRLAPLARMLATLHGLMLAAAGAVEVGRVVGLVQTVATAIGAGAAGIVVAVVLLVTFSRRGRGRRRP